MTVQTPPDSWRLFAEWLPILAPEQHQGVRAADPAAASAINPSAKAALANGMATKSSRLAVVFPATASYCACGLGSLSGWAGAGTPLWVGAEGGELPQPRPFQGGLGGGDAGSLSRHNQAECAGLDGAPDRRGQQDGLAVDADGDLGDVGVDGDLTGGEWSVPGRARGAGARWPAGRCPPGRRPRPGCWHPAGRRPPRPATSPISYGSLLTSRACGASILVPPAWAVSRAPWWPLSRSGSIRKVVPRLSSR